MKHQPRAPSGLAALSAVLGFCCLVLSLFGCSSSGRKVRVFIPKGLSTRAIAETLHQHRVIDNPAEFRFLARLLCFDRRLRQGRYDFAPHSEELVVLWQMTRPGHAAVRITIPEGYTMRRIADLLEEHGVCPASDFLDACQSRTLLDSLGISLATAEGYLYPDTYEFEIGSEPAVVIRRMVCRFFEVFEGLTDRAAQTQAPQSDREFAQSRARSKKPEIAEVLILASIVEREAVRPEEAPRIAGVFLNRLRKGIPLQSCATVEYVLPVHKDRLTIEDTRIESPYNTYLRPGLPPGPICNPGRNALVAVLRPETTDFLYFLSRGDGTHIFSRTWREHEFARRRLRRGDN